MKSLDGTAVDAARLVGPGALEGDRSYAVCDPDGEPVTGKRDAAVHRIRASHDLARGELTVHEQGAPEAAETFSLDAERGALNAWLSAALDRDRPVSLVRDLDGGHPDDTTAHGPTLVSTGTLRRVAAWTDRPVHEVRRRFRANVEVGGVPPFWEDGLYGPGETPGRLVVGDTELTVAGPCRRCVVPTRDPDTGRETPGFRETFIGRRRASWPAWAPRDRLGTGFRLAVNTAVPDQPAPRLAVGDPVAVPGAAAAAGSGPPPGA